MKERPPEDSPTPKNEGKIINFEEYLLLEEINELNVKLQVELAKTASSLRALDEILKKLGH